MPGPNWTNICKFAAGPAKDVKMPFSSTVLAYKLFRTKPAEAGKLFPLFVLAEEPVPMGVWVKAVPGPSGKRANSVRSKIGDLACRPGWHSGDLPVAIHIGGKSAPGLVRPDHRPDNHVWARVEHPADVDWQSVAESRARIGRGGKPVASTAHITDRVPYGGHYRYKTNPNMLGTWMISGDMKIVRVLEDEEVAEVNARHGVADLPRRGG
jgi:hypothetical protein